MKTSGSSAAVLCYFTAPPYGGLRTKISKLFLKWISWIAFGPWVGIQIIFKTSLIPFSFNHFGSESAHELPSVWPHPLLRLCNYSTEATANFQGRTRSRAVPWASILPPQQGLTCALLQDSHSSALVWKKSTNWGSLPSTQRVSAMIQVLRAGTQLDVSTNPMRCLLGKKIGVKSTFCYSFKAFSLFSTKLAVLTFIFPDGGNALSSSCAVWVPPLPLHPPGSPHCPSASPELNNQKLIWTVCTNSASFVAKDRKQTEMSSINEAVATVKSNDRWEKGDTEHRDNTSRITARNPHSDIGKATDKDGQDPVLNCII